MKRTTYSKTRYAQMLWTYEDRREKLRQRFGARQGVKNSEYRAVADKLSTKIYILRAAIKRFETREEFMRMVDNRIYDFIGYRVRMSKGDKERDLARSLFYKYCIEHHIPQREVSHYVGCKQQTTSGRGRLRFTRSFRTKYNNKDVWYRFSTFMKEQGQTISLHRELAEAV